MKKHDFADILTSRAWYDDDAESWNTEHLWMYGDGSYSTSDEDGNHESFSAKEVDDYCKEAEASWLEYAKWVAEHGKDPCGNYPVAHTEKVKESWEVKFTDWIGREQHGYAVYEARHGDKIYQKFSKPLADYLCLKKVGDRYCMEDITMEDIRSEATVEGNGPTYLIRIEIEYDKPRNPRTIAAEIRAAARKHLQIA